MRLTTLARKIDKTPTQLIAFLEKNEITISNGLHTKLDEDTVTMVLAYFIPDFEVTIDSEQIEKSKKNAELDSDSAKNEEAKSVEDTVIEKGQDSLETQSKNLKNKETEKETEQVYSPKTGTIEDLEEGKSEEIELIKVKKVKLEGIKVVGKIDLPDKSKKSTKKDEEEAVEDESSKESKKEPTSVKNTKTHPHKFDRKRSKRRHGKNRRPLSYDEKLKLEEREKIKKRRLKEKEEKQRKKQYYVQNIQPKVVPPVAKKKKKKSQDAAFKPKPKKAIIHKNPLKRLWAWLNGKYDQY